jgi:hypothetical protein
MVAKTLFEEPSRSVLRVQTTIAAALFIFSAFGCGGSHRHAPAGSWSTPTNIEGFPSDWFLRNPSMASFRDTIYVAANVQVMHEAVLPERPLFIGRLPGGRVEGPEGPFQFVYPKVAIGPDGIIHLVWAEYDSTRRDLGQWTQLQSSLWHAALVHGRWSKPDAILKSASVQWPWEDGRVTVDESGVLHVAAWVFTDRIKGLAHFRLSAGAWTSEGIQQVVVNPQVAIMVHRDTTWLAYSARDSNGPDDRIVLRRSILGSPPTITTIASLGIDHTLVHPQFVHSAEARYIVWTEAPPNVTSVDSLRVARVGASGATLVAAKSLPAGVSSFSVAGDRCGIAALLETFALAPRIFEVTVRDDGGVQVDSLFSDGRAGAFAGLAATDQQLVAVLNTWDDKHAAGVLMTRRQPCKP